MAKSGTFTDSFKESPATISKAYLNSFVCVLRLTTQFRMVCIKFGKLFAL